MRPSRMDQQIVNRPGLGLHWHWRELYDDQSQLRFCLALVPEECMGELATFLKSGLGLTEASLTAMQMVFRGIIVYLVMVSLVRIGKKRFMGAATAFDVILGFMIGSIASRAVTGNAPFMPSL